MAPSVPTIKLNSGFLMPQLGLGTSGLSGDKATEATDTALDMGYTHIDTAVMYGNEAQIGKSLAEHIKSGKVDREHLFIVTKLNNSAKQHSRSGVEPAIRESLQKLQLDYVDLVLIHWPITDRNPPGQKSGDVNPPIQETWKGLEDAVDKGLVKSIGISNFSSDKIDAWFSDVKIFPAVNQVEVHPHFRNDGLLKYCRDKGIYVTSYAPVSSPATMGNLGRKVPNLLTEQNVIDQIAEEHGKSPSQIILAWHLSQGLIAIPRSGNPSHQKENLEAADVQLSDEDIKTLSTLPYQQRYFTGQGMAWGPDATYKSYQDLWNADPALENN